MGKDFFKKKKEKTDAKLKTKKQKKVKSSGGKLNSGGKRTIGIKGKILSIVIVPMLILILLVAYALNTVGTNSSQKIAEQELSVAEYMYSMNIDGITYGGYNIQDGKLFKGTLEIKYKEKDLEDLYLQTGVNMAFLIDGGVSACSSGVAGVTMTEDVKAQIFKEGAEAVFVESYDINGQDCFAYFAPLPDEDGVIVASLMASIPKAEIRAAYAGIITANIIFIIALILVILVIMTIVVSKIVKGIISVVNNLAVVETGDLNVTVDKKLLERGDEVGRIARAVNSVVASISETIVNIHESMKELDEFSASFANNFNTIGESIDSINVAVNEIAEGSTQQAADTQSVSEGFVDMSNAVDRTTHNVNELSKSAAVMKQNNETVEVTLKELIQISERTEESVDAVQKQTNLTNASVQDIYTATDLIAGLANKTNLLSMNASIEAARAGEMGRGFAVVAEEIRGLADQSKESADAIRSIVQTLIDNSNQSVQIMDGVVSEIKLQGEKLEATGKVFDDLNEEVQNVVNAISDISGEIDNINSVKDRVVTNIDGLASVSENNAAGTEETVATMEQLDGVVADCRETTKELNRISDKLIENANKFKL